MGAWPYVVMFFCFLFATLIALGAWRVVVVERESHRRAVLRRAQQIEQEQKDREYFQEQFALIVEKYKTGYILDFVADNRSDLCNQKTKEVTTVTQVPRMKREIYNWCRSNMRGKWEMIPYMYGTTPTHRLWFEDQNDAMYFKMRWY